MSDRSPPKRPGPITRLLRWVGRRPVLALAIYWAFAAIVTRIPPIRPRRLPVEPDLHIDKIFHFVGFGILAWLMMNALTLRLRRRNAAVLTTLIIAVYGTADELTQPYFGRTADIWDFVANMLGCFAGVWVALWQGIRREAGRAAPAP